MKIEFSASILIPAALAAACLAAPPAAQAAIFRAGSGEVIPGTESLVPAPGIDLSNWNTPGHELQHAYLYVNLTGATFANSDLRFAAFDFSSNLTSVSFVNADLSFATFRPGARVTNADFSGALISGLGLSGAVERGLTPGQLYGTASYAAKNLRGVNLSSNHLTGWDFSGQDLTGSDFTSTTLTDALFTGANITGAKFVRSIVFDTGLRAPQLYSTASYANKSLVGLRLGGILSSPQSLETWDFSGQDLTDANLSYSNLRSALFAGATIDRINLTGVTNFTRTQLYSTTSYAAKNLRGILFNSATLGSTWDFSGQDLTDAGFSSASFTNANFTGALVTRANLSTSSFLASHLYSTASYAAGNLQGIHLRNRSIPGWNFTGQDLANANFSNANLTGALFLNARLDNATITGANLTNTTAGGLSSGAFYSTRDFQLNTLQGVRLGSNDLTGWIFSNKDLTDVNLSASILSGSHFEGSILTGAKLSNTTSGGFTAAQLYSTGSYGLKNLLRIDLSGNGLAGWNFAGQDLTDANFSASTLAGADFTGALFKGTNLSQAALTGANFTGALFQKTNLSAVTDFQAAQLYASASYAARDLSFINLASNAMAGWQLQGQNLAGADLASANLASANLAGANLQNAQLVKANFTGADLSGATLVGANVSSANFTNADLTDSTFNFGYANFNFTGTDLRGATGNYSHLPSITRNLIRPTGEIDGLALLPGDTLIIRNHTLPITPITAAHFDTLSTLRIELASDWGSIIRFSTHQLTPSLDGTLAIAFAPGLDPATLAGQTFPLFAWNTPPIAANRFDTITADPRITLDLSDLYTTGIISIAFVAPMGDASRDGNVDVFDLNLLAAHWQLSGMSWDSGDFTGDGTVDIFDLNLLAAHWQSTTPALAAALTHGSALHTQDFVPIPEPATLLLLLSGSVFLSARRPIRRMR